MPTVLVVDGDRGVRQSLARALCLEGFEVLEAGDGLDALDAITERPPDAVVLAVRMPGLDGVEVTRRIRTHRRTVPVCMVAARDQAPDRKAGLAAGADDCMVKPFAAGELTARLRALVRPPADGDGRLLVLGDLSIDPARRTATRRARDLDLTAREFDMLVALARHSGQVLGRGQLLAQVWGYTWEVDGDVLELVAGHLRRKLEAAGEPRILDVAGGGFVLRP